MKAHDRLYNSRLTRMYLEYLKHHYPDINSDRLLAYAGMTRLEVADPAHWFSQRQVDRFQKMLVKETGDRHISRSVGRFSTSSEGIGLVKRYALGFIKPVNTFVLINKFIPLLSRGAAIQTRPLGAARVEITATPYPGVQEKPYQCENRIGTFESMGMHFSKQYAEVEHPECYHRGDPCCRYLVRWYKSPHIRWNLIRNYSFFIDIPLAAAALLLWPSWLGVSVVLGLLMKTMLIAMYASHLEKKDLMRTIADQGNAAQEHIDEINMRYNNALLVQEVGKATASILNKEDFITAVIGIMENRLNFDRGSILLADGNHTVLNYVAGYGFGEKNDATLRNAHFNLANTASKGIFVRSFLDQKPMIVEDINTIKHHFSAKSRALLENIQARSLICVPIIYEKQSLGIIAVDNIKSQKKLSQSDLNLIMGLASQVAVGIANALSFEKLQKSEEKFRDIFENVTDFLYYHDLDGGIINTNRSFQRVSGYDDNALSQMNIRDMIPARFRSSFDDYLHEIKVTGHSEGSMRLLKKDGGEFIIDFKNSLVHEHDQPIGVRGSARDITDQWLAKKEKRGLQKKLEQAQKMEAIGTLAGGVAHDLNNILSGIVSFPDMLLKELPPESLLRDSLRIIRDSGQKAATIVQDLLTMARRGVRVTDVIDLNMVVSSYLRSPEHQKLASYHPDTQIDAQLADNTMNIKGSPVHLAKTVMNLVSNAVEAMPEGGRISIRTENRYVDAPIRGYDIIEEGDYVVFEIADAGIGISKDDQKRIFEPFYTKKKMGRSGTGLGMAVVWATVKDHKGFIDVASGPGSGTVFTLYFPATREKMMAPADAVPIEAYMGRGERILVVDDVDEQREIASVMLRKLGYQVEAAPNGEAAVEVARAQQPDLVVLDMIMDPGMDGLETYQKLLEINARQKAIIASGFSESEKVRTALQIGVGAYLKKPYLLEQIGLAIRTELDR